VRERARAGSEPGLRRHDGYDGLPDLDLVALLQTLRGVETAPVEPGAVGRAEVLDKPQAVGHPESAVVAGGEVVADGQVALAASGEVGLEGMALVSCLDDQGPGGRCLLDEGGAGLRSDRGHGDFPGLLLLLGGLLPRRQVCGVRATVGFIGGSCELLEAGTGHPSMMPGADAAMADRLIRRLCRAPQQPEPLGADLPGLFSSARAPDPGPA